jgi:hypothetical protein
VNAALARTRTATLLSIQENPDASASKQDKQFYLAKEFEAHLAAIRISAATIVDSPDDSQLDFDLLAAPPPLQPSPKKMGSKRKRARSTSGSSLMSSVFTSGSSLMSSVGEGRPSQAPSTIVVSTRLQEPVVMPLHIGTMGDASSMNNCLQVQPSSIDVPFMHQHIQQQVGQNTMVVPTDMLVRPTSILPSHVLPQAAQSSQLLMFSGQSRLLQQSNSRELTPSRERMQDKYPPVRAVPCPPQLSAAPLVLANSTKKKTGMVWNRASSSSVKVGSSSHVPNSSSSSPKQQGESTSPHSGTVTMITENGEVKCDCGGTFRPEEDAKGVPGLQSHISTTQHQ